MKAVTPKPKAKTLKRERSDSSVPSGRSSKRARAPQAIINLTEVIRDASTHFKSSTELDNSTITATPERRRAAVGLLVKDGNLAGASRIQALCLFRRDISIADTYLAIEEKDVRAEYIQEELVTSL